LVSLSEAGFYGFALPSCTVVLNYPLHWQAPFGFIRIHYFFKQVDFSNHLFETEEFGTISFIARYSPPSPWKHQAKAKAKLLPVWPGRRDVFQGVYKKKAGSYLPGMQLLHAGIPLVGSPLREGRYFK